MQVSMLTAELGLGSEIIDGYRDATSVPYGHLLFDLLPRADNRLRCFANIGTILSNFFIPDLIKQSKVLSNGQTKIFYSLSVPITFPQMQKSFPSVLSKRVYQVPLRLYSKTSQTKPAKHKRASRDKV